jgi:succinyl-diaminopimelate desuccinylase
MEKLKYELELLRKLIRFNTDAIKKTYYKECAEVIKEECEKIGLKVDIYDGEEEAKDNISRPSVVAKLERESDKTVLLLTHYDIVPEGKGWTKDPFNLTIEDNKAYGRGCADDKGCIAVALGAIKEVLDKSKYNVIFVSVPEEEIGGKYGAGYVSKKLNNIDEVLVLDAGNEYISIGASGVVFGEIKVYGDQGHAGYPFRYRNAAQDLIRLLYHLSEFSIIRARKISKFDAPPESPIPKNFGRFSITMLGAGEKENVIPGLAYARFDMRLIPEENYEEAINEFKTFFIALTNSLGIKAEISWIEGGGNYVSDPNSPSVIKFKKIASEEFNKDLKIVTEFGGNDGKYFANRNIPIISFGLAAKDTRFHGADEFAYLDDMLKLKSILIKYLTT